MNDFHTYVADYQHMLEGEAPLDPEFEASLTDSELPAELPLFPNQASLFTHRPEPAAGQVWLLKSEVNLTDYALPSGDKPLLETSWLNLVVITQIGKHHLGKADFQEIQIAPLSEELLMASSWDLLLENPSLESLGPSMIEIWNRQPILALQLEQCLGELNALEKTQVQTLATHWETQTPVQDPQLPVGGTVLSKTGAHQQFQNSDRQQAQKLTQPFQALQQGLQSLRPLLVEVSHRGFKAAPGTEKLPHWLNLPKPYRPSQSAAPLLAASSTEAPTQEQTKQQKQAFRLTDQLLLEMWVEGPNLEFYSRLEGGDDVEGLGIWYADKQGIQRQIITDELGTAFLALDSLPVNEPLLLELTWESQSWHYAFVYPGE